MEQQHQICVMNLQVNLILVVYLSVSKCMMDYGLEDIMNMKNRENMYLVMFLILCIFGMLSVRYCYDEAIIEQGMARILNFILGIPSFIVLLYSFMVHIKKQKKKV